MKCAECPDGALSLKDSRFGKFYGCSNWPACKGSIGAHQKPPYAPLGIPANPETKALRIALHAKLDPLWKGKPKGTRGQVYARVSAFIGKPFHTGESDAETCRKVMAWLDDPASGLGLSPVATRRWANSSEIVPMSTRRVT